MNILFLDIDGVLNSAASFVALGSSYPREDPRATNLSPVSCGLVDRLCRECDLAICVHSTWATGDNMEYLTAVLRAHRIGAPVVGLPAALHDRRARLRHAIDRLSPETYIVIDDIDMSADFGERMICTDADEGFGFADYSRALLALGKTPRLVIA